MIKWLLMSVVLCSLYISIAWGGLTISKNAAGFLLDDSSYADFANQIPLSLMNSYTQFLGVNNLRFATINLPSASNQNNVYPFNLSNGSLLRIAEARLNNNVVANGWEIIRDQNNNHVLTFSRIITDINFQQPVISNPGENFIANICWDPNITGNVAWGITFKRGIYKVYRNGNNIIAEQRLPEDSSGGGIASAIGDFNNDGKVDFFEVLTNEDNQSPTKAKSASVFVQGNNETFSRINININSWNQGQTRVDLKWTAGSILSTYQKYDNNTQKYTTEKFDYNNDGRQDIMIASADGAIYVIPNQSSGNTISFGNPIKLVTTGVSTRNMDGSYNGAQVISGGDINKDGIIDIVVGSTDSPQLYIYYGKRDNQGRIYFGGDNPNTQSLPDVKLYDGEVSSNQRIVRRYSEVERSDYKGPNAQQNGAGNGSPFPEYTGAATNIVLADINRDNELDILIATDNWHFSPTHYRIGDGQINTFDLSIKHTDRNATLRKAGGRIFYMIRNPENGKYRNFFLGQYALTDNNQNADFDNATIVNFSGPTAIDYIATDGNHARTLFSFLQAGSMYINADNFIIESKDLISKNGNSTESFDFNNSLFYIKSITLKIIGNFNQIPTSVMIANRIQNNIPQYFTINIPSYLLDDTFTRQTPLEVEIDFYPSDSRTIRFRINGGNWQTTNTERMRGPSIVYRLVFDTSDNNLKQDVVTLTGQTIRGLNRTVEIREIQVSYEAVPQSLRIRNWKEVR